MASPALTAHSDRNSRIAKGHSLGARVSSIQNKSKSKEDIFWGKGNTDIEALWLEENDVARCGKERRWSMEL